jgi:biopolymer transport protein ExbD
MAMSAAGRTGSVLAEINVTPMADIMIVLLIIFMVATPIMVRDEVRLPPADSARERKEDDRTIVLAVRRSGATLLGRERIDRPEALRLEVKRRLEALPEGRRTIHFKADEGLPYSVVQQVMDLCREAGAEELALMADRKVRSRP